MYRLRCFPGRILSTKGSVESASRVMHAVLHRQVKPWFPKFIVTLVTTCIGPSRACSFPSVVSEKNISSFR